MQKIVKVLLKFYEILTKHGSARGLRRSRLTAKGVKLAAELRRSFVQACHLRVSESKIWKVLSDVELNELKTVRDN